METLRELIRETIRTIIETPGECNCPARFHHGPHASWCDWNDYPVEWDEEGELV